MNHFMLLPELKIGHVVEVAGTSIKVELSADVGELTKNYDGRVYSVGQIGSIVKVHFGRRLIFGFVTLLRMRSEEYVEQGKPIPVDADQRLMEVELFAEGIWNGKLNKLELTRGITTYPLPLQTVHLLTKEETGVIFTAAEGSYSEDDFSPMVAFGSYVGAEGTTCHANIDKMLGLHCAVLGSTGSGKSGAVAALLHSMLEHKPKQDTNSSPRIVIIDPHGEYGSAFNNKAVVYKAYDPIGNDNDTSETISLPYWLLSADEFRTLVIGKTESEATSQNNIIYKALTHSRMVAAGLVASAPNRHGIPPNDMEDHEKPRIIAGFSIEDVLKFDRDKPRPFCLNELYNHIFYIQASRVQNGLLQPITATDFSKSFKSVLDKLSVLRLDPRIRFMMSNWRETQTTLQQVLSQFVGQKTHEDGTAQDIRIIDISGLPNEVAGPLTSMVARLLFNYKVYQTQEERKRDPVVLVCEEAHRYVPNKGEAEYASAQNSIKRIAREGRKYGVSLMLVSQRPADIEGTVISQCGTWVVLRLTNASDQQQVSKFLPDGLSGMTKILPNLVQQEAIFVGEGAAMPCRIKIRDLPKLKLPRSENIKFAAGWSEPRLTEAELDVVAVRMAGPVAPVPRQVVEVEQPF